MINFNQLKPSASMEMTRLAVELQRDGVDIKNLSIGDTHFSMPKSIASKIGNVPEKASHYGSAQGMLLLREQISQKYKSIKAEDIVIVPGLKQGLYYLLSAIGGSQAVALEPAWLGYQAACTLAGIGYTGINTYDDNWLQKLAHQEFDILILCSPNNPDGKVIAKEIMNSILNIAESKGSIVILDSIYNRFVYSEGSLEHAPINDRLIIANGFSKSHAMTGHRVGYLVIPHEIILEKVVRIQQNLATCPSNFSQHLISTCIDPGEIEEFREYYHQNVKLTLEIFPEWHAFAPSGGFYFFVDLAGYGVYNSKDFCLNLLKFHGISIVPGSAYGTGFDSFVRISICVDSKMLKKALIKLKKILNNES